MKSDPWAANARHDAHMKALFVLVLAAGTGVLLAAPLGSIINYQGRLMDGDSAANGEYDLRCRVSTA